MKIQVSISTVKSASQSAKTTGNIDVFEALALIKQGSKQAKAARQEYQTNGKSDHYNQLKLNTPAVLWNVNLAKGSKRKASEVNPESLTGLVYLDFDNVEFDSLVDSIKALQPLAYWKSLSGSGLGVLFVYDAITCPDYNQAWAYFNAKIGGGISVDKATKDVTRVNVLSYDPELVINDNYLTHQVPFQKRDYIRKAITEQKFGRNLITESEKWNALINKFPFEPGQRYESFIQMTSLLNRLGVELEDAWTIVEQQTNNEINPSWKKQMTTAYENWKDQFSTEGLELIGGTENSFHNLFKIDASLINHKFGRNYEIDQRWTSNCGLIGQTQYLAIKAAKNTGKSTVSRQWIEQPSFNGKTIILGTYRRTLTEKLRRDFPTFEHYLDNPEYKEGGKYIICIHSLHKIPQEILVNAVVVLDEAHSIHKSLMLDENLKRQRKAVIDAYRLLITESEGILALDADLSVDDVNYLIKLQPKVNFLLNKFQPKAGQKIQIVRYKKGQRKERENALIAQVSAEGQKTYIPCSMASTAEALYEVLTERLPELNINLLTAATKTTEENQSFLSNPNEVSYDILIVSPCFEAGNSMENGNFTQIVAAYEGDHQSLDSFFQQITRERGDIPTSIYNFSPNQEHRMISKVEALNNLLNKGLIQSEGHYNISVTDETELAAALIAEHSQQVYRPALNLALKAQSEGYIVEFVEVDRNQFEEELVSLTNIKKQLKQLKNQEIAEAQILTEEQVDTLKGRELSSEEAANLTKTYTANFIKSDEVTAEDVAGFRNTKKVDAVRNIELINTYKDAAYLDSKEKEFNYFVNDLTLNQKRFELLKTLNLDYFIANIAEIEQKDLDELFELLQDEQIASDMFAAFGLNVRKYSYKNSLLREVLALVGINTQRTKEWSSELQKSYNTITISEDSWVFEVVDQREAARVEKRQTIALNQQLELQRQLEAHKQFELETQLLKEGKLSWAEVF